MAKKFCKFCGSENEGTRYCTNCGARNEGFDHPDPDTNPQVDKINYHNTYEDYSNREVSNQVSSKPDNSAENGKRESLHWFLFLLSMIPFVGFALFIIMHSSKPAAARQALIMQFVGVGLLISVNVADGFFDSEHIIFSVWPVAAIIVAFSIIFSKKNKK